MHFNPKNKPALITGANRGIGLALAEGLLAAGASKVYAAVRNPKSADALVKKHGESRVVPIECDLSKPATIRAAAERAKDAQLVINNAGILTNTPVLSDNIFDDMRHIFDVNVSGLLHVAHAFAPILERNSGGAFVQLNSVVSFKAFPEFATYCASKAAAYSFTQALRALLEPRGVAVFSVHPGPIATDMAKDAGIEEMAEPPSQVSDALLAAFKSGDFHVYTDTMSRQMGEAYATFARDVIEAEMDVA